MAPAAHHQCAPIATGGHGRGDVDTVVLYYGNTLLSVSIESGDVHEYAHDAAQGYVSGVVWPGEEGEFMTCNTGYTKGGVTRSRLIWWSVGEIQPQTVSSESFAPMQRMSLLPMSHKVVLFREDRVLNVYCLDQNYVCGRLETRDLSRAAPLMRSHRITIEPETGQLVCSSVFGREKNGWRSLGLSGDMFTIYVAGGGWMLIIDAGAGARRAATRVFTNRYQPHLDHALRNAAVIRDDGSPNPVLLRISISHEDSDHIRYLPELLEWAEVTVRDRVMFEVPAGDRSDTPQVKSDVPAVILNFPPKWCDKHPKETAVVKMRSDSSPHVTHIENVVPPGSLSDTSCILQWVSESTTSPSTVSVLLHWEDTKSKMSGTTPANDHSTTVIVHKTDGVRGQYFLLPSDADYTVWRQFHSDFRGAYKTGTTTPTCVLFKLPHHGSEHALGSHAGGSIPDESAHVTLQHKAITTEANVATALQRLFGSDCPPYVLISGDVQRNAPQILERVLGGFLLLAEKGPWVIVDSCILPVATAENLLDGHIAFYGCETCVSAPAHLPSFRHQFTLHNSTSDSTDITTECCGPDDQTYDTLGLLGCVCDPLKDPLDTPQSGSLVSLYRRSGEDDPPALTDLISSRRVEQVLAPKDTDPLFSLQYLFDDGDIDEVRERLQLSSEPEVEDFFTHIADEFEDPNSRVLQARESDGVTEWRMLADWILLVASVSCVPVVAVVRDFLYMGAASIARARLEVDERHRLVGALFDSMSHNDCDLQLFIEKLFL
ncbi:hypothetical protein KIPB_000055 [Kipferlia bialata]|uniref:Uncharacterized protein n=1 Tax=Kipferlia bialata TaxID=797122 RepID=A0A9K3GEF6_9EUKA|nr:hypothetical protein KIPB_000055 [Kipferlia bialata]|eukprot:g55.t1